MLKRELPIWVAAVAIVVVLLIVGIIYWRLSVPSGSPPPSIRTPGVPITAKPPGSSEATPGPSPVPITARPGIPPTSSPPQSAK